MQRINRLKVVSRVLLRDISGWRIVVVVVVATVGGNNEVGEMEKVVSKTRTSSNAWCMHSCERLPGVRSATKKIEEVTGIPYVNYESFQLLNYEKNQFYRSHHDSSSTDTTPAGHRILTFFLYLSDVEEGGETYFNKLDLAVKPKKGKALVWPSVRDDNPTYWDARMFHEAKDVIKGKKWQQITGFI